MSEIDQYQHRCIGVISCPSTYEFVKRNSTNRLIPLYRLDESAIEWDSKPGDLVLGGGAGESEALRISIPEAINYFTNEDWDPGEMKGNVYKAYWSMTGAYVFGEGMPV
jgi:hypothetical protein